ncbi:MAG: glycosyltransferase [Rhodocyclaceae bacterium]|nr:glycosyltransferase [Rhodocyclaceae bacterium]
MSRVRVLHVYRTYFPDPPGGLQEAIRQIAVASRDFDVEPKIFALSPSPTPIEIERPEGTVVRSRSWAAPASCDLGAGGAFRLFADLSDWADVIHYHFPWPFADLLHMAVRPKALSIMTYHSDIVRQRLLGRVYAPLMGRMLRSMHAVVATSPAYARSSPVLSASDVAARVHVIPLGIDDRSYPEKGDESILARLGLTSDERYFLFIGVLRYYKGLHALIEAAASVCARIVIAGTGPEENALKQQVQDHGARNVVFAGQVSDPEKVALLSHCYGFVLPSHLRSEAFGMVLVESAMFGKPMISCEIGTGTSFVNADAETGFVVPPEDPRALAAAMNRLLSDVALAEGFGKAARQRFDSLFSGEALGKAYASLYRQVVRGR